MRLVRCHRRVHREVRDIRRKNKCKNNISHHTFLKRQVKKMLHVLPWKPFTVTYKQLNLLSSQKTKNIWNEMRLGKGPLAMEWVSGWWMLVVLEAMTGARKWERESKRGRQLGKRVRWAPAWARRATTGSAVKSSNTREVRCSRLHVPAVSEHRKKEKRKTVISRSSNVQRKSASWRKSWRRLLRPWLKVDVMECSLHA